MLLPKNAASIDRYYAQMTALQRVIEYRSGKPEAVWVGSKPDHYLHAANYENIAWEVRKMTRPRLVVGVAQAAAKIPLPAV